MHGIMIICIGSKSCILSHLCIIPLLPGLPILSFKSFTYTFCLGRSQAIRLLDKRILRRRLRTRELFYHVHRILLRWLLFQLADVVVVFNPDVLIIILLGTRPLLFLHR